ncbi:hypothetical protein KM1_000730 [Entamoeba histolytica HM-3:IMSS]|uniref:WWE domain-containing protein n=5 Tax=Entamoeba histolytica TaxID=5759 RepID=C4LSL0_ENTH1|nr:hypothetical protein EHI_151690 [Entamoeba histolytica HM-1:IMSS]EMD46637.1 Hypothetical protein EHI5A_000370 [Entamoeba histolytica KU27]EMS17284.1 hypothetical protein KM1_000730 [Entamoeba histolytica HM-3:IMSS]ENY59916.1 hypothetical protein EHI7A_000370 [Entamoeba histolytica HM-1:IMSS-A]GAT91416.1 hypothetical protein CL6EHI_151690 [Entamoeba histolytica]EAL52026.2 hypothetical protein EHI_151690 [Entamoeba histolytica HM-1:IMSS]|eukprot:XP_657412.2 hypothetical protein EHI_151690 [Entamoeba histolytica HM-1:IMSS]
MSVKWQWLDDYQWVDYDKKTSSLLEKSYLEGKKSESCDKERFVEFCDIHTIHDNFSSLPKDYKSLVGIQRRKDNPNRRRLVQRLMPATYDGYIVYIIKESLEDGVDYDGLIDIIKLRKGKITNKINNSTLVVCDETKWNNDVKKLIQQVLDDKIPIVTSTFVNKSLDSYKLTTKDLQIKNNEFTQRLNEKKEISIKRMKTFDDLFQAKRKIDLNMIFSIPFEIKEIDDTKIILMNEGKDFDLPVKPNRISNVVDLLKGLSKQLELKFNDGKVEGNDGEKIKIEIQ